jgi:prephenate dehydrogenase
MPTDPTTKHYRRITIIGTGAVGCSIACLARGRGLVDEIVGVDRDTAHLEMARRLGFVDRAEDDPARGVMGAEAVVFAGPLDEIFMVIKKAGADIRPDALVTCTAGTTQRLWSQLVNEVPAMTSFVPSFPLVYSSTRGPGAASASLLQDRHCIVVNSGKSSEEAVQRVASFWVALGTRVEVLDTDPFEWRVAGSHFWPHMLIASLKRVVKDRSLRVDGTSLQQWLDAVGTEVDLQRSYQLYSSRLCSLMDDLVQDLSKVRWKLGGKPDDAEPEG